MTMELNTPVGSLLKLVLLTNTVIKNLWFIAIIVDLLFLFSAYLQDYGHPVDLQVLLQVNYYSGLGGGVYQKGEPMTIAIGSKRMHNFFVQWLCDEGER